jgi:starvation-inducible DNA-binding protein
MNKTKNDLPAKTQTEMIQLLNARLSDAIDLELQTKQAHWNVKGPSFIGLHELFDRLAEEVEDHIDTIAERIVQLGGVAHGTIQEAQRKTTLPIYPTDIFEGPLTWQPSRVLTLAFGKVIREANRHRRQGFFRFVYRGFKRN